MTGGMRGGVGSASAVLGDGTVVAALVVANSAGSPVDPGNGLPYGRHLGLAGEFPLAAPGADEHAAARERLAALAAERGAALNTVIGVVATSAALDRARAQRLAGAGHDGLARAVRPAHTLVDGDALFGVATGEHPLREPAVPALNAIYAAGADVVGRAIVRAVLAAEPVTTPYGHIPAYRELYPSVLTGPWPR